jgi:hypothetical protein
MTRFEWTLDSSPAMDVEIVTALFQIAAEDADELVTGR